MPLLTLNLKNNLPCFIITTLFVKMQIKFHSKMDGGVEYNYTLAEYTCVPP